MLFSENFFTVIVKSGDGLLKLEICLSFFSIGLLILGWQGTRDLLICRNGSWNVRHLRVLYRLDETASQFHGSCGGEKT